MPDHHLSLELPGSTPDLMEHRRAVVISGASGAGKTTMMRRLYRSLSDGAAVILEQTSNPPPHMTPRQLVVFYAALFGHYKPDLSLVDVGIGHIMDRRFGEMNHPELSGGEKRRAHLMAILAIPPERCPIILLDEPFQGLDDASGRMVAEALRAAAKHRSIVLCLHHVPPFVSEWIDEEWSISVLPDSRVVSVRVFDDVIKTDDPPLRITKRPMRSLVEMWALIRYRDMLMGWMDLAAKVLTPIAICLFPMACYGSPGRMWEEFTTEPSPDIMLATGIQIIIHIVMFVCAIIPVVFLSTHVQWKEIVDNESSCGLYRRSSFIISRMFSEIATMASVCVIIQSVLFMRAPGLISVFSWASWSMMGVTHSLIWVCLYTLRMPFIWCLLTIIAYTAVSFISHIGFLLRWPVLQELSVLTVEMSLVLHKLTSECSSPAHARVLRAIRSTLQTDALVGLSVRDWIVRSVVWYPIAPVLFMILGYLIDQLL